MKRKFAAILLVLALTLTILPLGAAFAAGNQSVLDARNSVVRIFAYSNYMGEGYIGSGICVGNAGDEVEYIATNLHVVTDSGGYECDEVYVVLDNLLNRESIIPATIVKIDPIVDLCIIKVDTPLTTRVPITMLSADTVEPTQTVYALGFPGTSDDLDDEGYVLPSRVDDITVTTGTVTKNNATSSGADFIQIDVTVNPGNSGGALVTEDGYCVGLNTFGATGGEATNGAIYVDYVFDALEGLNVGYELGNEQKPDAADPSGEVTEPQTPENTAPLGGTLLYVLIGAAALVVVAVVVIVVVSSGKKKNAPQPVQAFPAQPVPQPAPQPAQPSRTVPLNAAQANAQQGAAAFSLVGSAFGGNVFPLRESAVIGRNANSCNIVYPENSPGVSSVHCRVALENGALNLYDMNSSYGTFLENGVKLEPNKAYPLHEGDSFYLAKRENTFTVVRR